MEPDFYADDYEAAISFLLSTDHLSPVGKDWCHRAALRLIDRLNRYLRGDTTVLRTEQMALAELRKAGAELEEGAKALDWAADRLVRSGDGVGGNRVKRSAQACRQAALVLTGGQ
jgi:hypothetical protein